MAATPSRASNCARGTEPAAVGNLLYTLEAEGRSSNVWESWNCGHDGCGFSLTILHRHDAVDRVECYGDG
jgi:hypothetical protein